MSAVLERTGIVLPDEQTLREPYGKPTRSKQRTKSERRSSPLAIAVGFSIRVALASFILTCVSAGVCQYLFEQARHAGNSANARAQAAEGALTGMRRDVDRLQSAERIETWAALNGFIPSYIALNEKPE